jgi:hypothetical protein
MPAAAQATEILTRAATFAPSTFDPAKRSVQVIWSTGAPVNRMDFDGPYVERLSLDPEAVDLSQLRGAPLLDTHDRWSVRNILGVVQDPSVDGQQGIATVRFSERADVAPVMADVQAGIISRVSVGYSVQSWNTTKDTQGNRTKTAVRWTPLEISFTALAADRGAHVRSAMPETQLAIADQIRAAGTLLGADDQFTTALATREGVGLEDARRQLLEHIRGRTPVIQGRAEVTRDESEGFLDRAVNAVAHRACSRIQLIEGARPWAGRRLSDIGREILRMHGITALGGDHEIFARWGMLHTTSDFANFLAQLFNKSLLPQYLPAPSGLKLLARASTANDFRAKNIYRDSPMGPLQKVNEHGEFKRVSKPDVKPESYSVATYAAVFGISRQALVNDDLSVFSDISSELALQATEFENAQLATLLISNPVLSDGNALFSTAHGNLAATPAAIDTQPLSDARLAMRLSKNQNGQPIAVTPKYLLVPATQETAGQKALSGIYPAQIGNVNPFDGMLELVVDPRLDAAGGQNTKSWYTFGDPAIVPVLEFSYLSGAEGPQIETRVGFSGGSDIDGAETLVRLDYGAGVIGSVGCYKNAGV